MALQADRLAAVAVVAPFAQEPRQAALGQLARAEGHNLAEAQWVSVVRCALRMWVALWLWNRCKRSKEVRVSARVMEDPASEETEQKTALIDANFLKVHPVTLRLKAKKRMLNSVRMLDRAHESG